MENTITVEQQSANAIKWLEALLSGKYKQGEGHLGNATVGYCCWGLGCHITKRAYEPYDAWDYQLHEQLGYWNEEGILGIDFKGYTSLWKANDSGCTFDEIAQHLITYAGEHFIPEVAEAITKHFQPENS